MADQIIKVFGERNTGTRALNLLLKQVPGVRFRISKMPRPTEAEAEVQTAVETQLQGMWKRMYLHTIRDEIAVRNGRDDPWKHALPVLTKRMKRKGVATIHMIRDPYSWLVALARRPYHIKGPNAPSLEAFSVRPWMTERREGLPAVVKSPSVIWSLKAAATLAYGEEAADAGVKSVVIRFEDFVQDPVAEASRAIAEIGMPAVALTAQQRNTKTGAPSLEELKAHYREERWTAWLTEATVARVNGQIDWAVAKEFGYHRRSPQDYPATLPEDTLEQMRKEMSGLAALHREAGATTAT